MRSEEFDRSKWCVVPVAEEFSAFNLGSAWSYRLIRDHTQVVEVLFGEAFAA